MNAPNGTHYLCRSSGGVYGWCLLAILWAYAFREAGPSGVAKPMRGVGEAVQRVPPVAEMAPTAAMAAATVNKTRRACLAQGGVVAASGTPREARA